MLPEDCLVEIVKVLLENGEKPTATKLRIALGKNYKSPISLPNPIVFTVKIEDFNTDIYIGTNTKAYKIKVNWGDDKIEYFSKTEKSEEIKGIETLEKITHKYSSSGVYKIGIFGECVHIQLPIQTIEVLSIGKITSCKFLLKGCEMFNAPLKLDTRAVTDMSGIFEGCKTFNQSINFNTSAVNNMSYMFFDCYTFNQPLNIDTVMVTNIDGMFYSCYSFNQPLQIDTSNVTDMSYMFADCDKFNQPLQINTSKVTDMSYMFYRCLCFNQPLNFTISSKTKTDNMFSGCWGLDQKNIKLFHK